MDTLTAPPPVAAPAAIIPPPAPAVAPAQEAPKTPLNTVTGKPISEAAHNLFKMLEESGDPLREEPEKKTDTAVEPAKATDRATPATTSAEPEKPIKVSRKTPKRPELPIQKDEPVATVVPTVVREVVASTIPPNWEESLIDEEKAALEDARFAEKVDPKFKGLSDRMGEFFRKQKEYLEANPDADENDPKYKAILAMQPTVSVADKRAIAEARIVQRVSKEYEPKLAEVQHELYVRDEEPKIENEGQQIRRYMAFNALPKEMLGVLKEKGLPVLQKEYADELEVAGNLINTLTEDAKELLRITRLNPRTQRTLGQIADNPAHPKWEQHDRIAKMVNEVCADFQRTAPQAEQVRDGKWFVTREEWAKLPQNSRHQFWTFTNSEPHVREMINRAMGWMPDAISRNINARQDALKARGYERRRPEIAPMVVAPTSSPTPSSSPSSPRPSAAPAPTSTSAGQMTPGQMLAARLKAE